MNSFYAPALALILLVGCQPSEPQQPVSTESAGPVVAETEPTGETAEVLQKIDELKVKHSLDKLGFVTAVDLRQQELTPEIISLLRELVQLQSLLLNESKIDEAAATAIGQCKHLKNLDLRDCTIGNAELQQLAGLTELKALRLSGKSGATSVDDDGLAAINDLKNLKVLALDFLWVSGAGLEQLTHLSGLEELYLAGTLVGDEDLQQLKLFPSLKKLRVSKLSQLSRPGLEEIAKLSALEDLDLSENSAIFDADVEPLSQLTNLKRLNLWRVAITDAGVAPLQNLVRLEWLNLDNTQMTDAGLKSLTGMQQLTFLHVGSTAVSDTGITELGQLKSLKDLKVTRTAVTENGVAELQKLLPGTEIQLKYLGNE